MVRSRKRQRAFSVLGGLTAFGVIVAISTRATGNELAGITAVAPARLHTCALTTVGGVKCWGDNDLGQLGDNRQYTDRAVPGDVSGLTGGVVAIASGTYHTCAVTSAGGVKCWGWNRDGQLGVPVEPNCPDPIFNGHFPCSPVPVDVTGLTDGVAAIAAGYGHSCVITIDAALKCWGSNYMGQLGNETTVSSAEPVDVPGLSGEVVSVALGFAHTCAVTSAGRVLCWGRNINSQLGIRSRDFCADPFTPEPVPCSTVPLAVCKADDGSNECAEPLSGVTAVTAGISHTCALTAGGGVKCWGSGPVGDGTSETTRTSPVDVAGLSSGVAAVSAGSGFGFHACALMVETSVKCWGNNLFAQLGAETSETCGRMPCSTVPVSVLVGPDGPSLNQVESVALGSFSTCGLMLAGNLKCWGQNTSGQLGTGTRDDEPHPIPTNVLVFGPKPTATPTATSTPTPTATPRPPFGDVNCDGIVDAVDAALVLQLEAALIAWLRCQEKADVNADRVVNAVDAVLILERVAGLIEHF